MANFHPISEVKALTFDVFGTVVDWRKSIAREIKQVGIEKGFILDWDGFADEWRAGYGPSMNKVRTTMAQLVELERVYKH